MKERKSLYISRSNPFTWITAALLLISAIGRIVFACLDIPGYAPPFWSQLFLPVFGTLLYAAIVLISGKERFYKTGIAIALLGLYYCYAICNFGFSGFTKALCWLVIVCFVFAYARIASGKLHLWFMPVLLAVSLLAVAYLNRTPFLEGNWLLAATSLPDGVLFLGLLIMLFGLRLHPAGEYHPTWGDRPDGRRVRTLPPMSQVSPYIMPDRNDATNLFADSLEITGIERYIRQKRKEGMTNFGIMHVLLACYLRTLAKYPALNRFLAGQKVYSRGNDVQFCMVVKKEMTSDAPDTVIKVHLDPHDTVNDVYKKLNAEIEKVKNTPLDSSFDNVAHLLTLIPGVFLKFTVWLLKTMDYFGLLPKFLLEVSPFHGSVFFTSMGSLGIPPIYHHLYNFGNMPLFGAFGCKRTKMEVAEDGTLTVKKYVDVKFTTDERIVDGFYYATFFKAFKRIMRHPEALELPPEEVVPDID